jgi:hypothetical protein
VCFLSPEDTREEHETKTCMVTGKQQN